MASPSPSRSSPSAMWPSAMLLLFSASASRSDSSSTFFARGVNGMWPFGARVPRRGVERARSEGRLHAVPDGVQVDADRAEGRGVEPLVAGERADGRHGRLPGQAVPGQDGGGRGVAGRAGRGAGARCRCGWGGARRASSCAPTTTCRASSVNRSNIAQSLRRSGPRPLAYFLCTACRETPSSWAICSHVQPWSRALLHLEGLQPLDERPQRPDRLQPDGGVPAAGGGCHLRSCPSWLST